MIYLKQFNFPSINEQDDYRRNVFSTFYHNYYPFGLFEFRLDEIKFSDITIFYGGNGTGKSTALNVIAEKFHAKTSAPINNSDFFNDFVKMCTAKFVERPENIKKITSDDVFKNLLENRNHKQAVAEQREALIEHYKEVSLAAMPKYSPQIHEQWMDASQIKKKSCSQYVKDKLGLDETMQSNGETAFQYLIDSVKQHELILLDEPENSLSAEWQISLKDFLEKVPTTFDGQVIIATHSPFLLSIENALIYDFDSNYKEQIVTRKWTDLHNVRLYYDFFCQHADEFE